MKSKIEITILAAALSFVAFAAFAADPEAFKAADADQDGYVTAAEAEAVDGLPEKFAEIDANEDGQIDEAEFSMFETE